LLGGADRQSDYGKTREIELTHTLTAKEQSLAKIFSDDYVFTIPGYQRPYSWGKDQAQELLDDLLAAMTTAPDQLSEAAPYFLGSIVLIKAEAKPEATVVDGQQRLTTLTLLLSAIRASVQDGVVQTGVTKRIYEHGDIVSATQARYRLSLRERDRDFFRQYVQHEDGMAKLLGLNSQLPDAQARILINAQVFMTGLAKLSQAELIRLVQFIITRCYLVTVATPDLDSAYRIFGVLNSRGLDLTATDILKAEVIGGIAPNLRDTYTKKWEDEEEDLGRDEFGELFSHIRMVYRKAKPQGTLLKEFKEHVAPAAYPQAFVEEVLLPMAQAFSEISNADYSSQKHAEQINTHLHWLNRLDFKDWVPPALTFFVRNHNQPVAMLEFFRGMERLAYSMLSRKCGINERIERFSALTSAIEKAQHLNASQSPLHLTPLEQYETYSALNGPLYETHSPRAVATLMLRLDHLMSDGTASYQNGVVSVEHILPQQPAPNSQWLTWVPDPLKHEHWVHRLGNLTLLSRKKNSAASNYEFEKKKNAYFTKGGICAFALTTEVLTHNDWTESVMQQRQERMIKVLETHWCLQDRKSRAELAEAKLAETQQASGDAFFELESAKHGLNAKAREYGDSFTVLAGSQAKRDWTAQPHAYMQLRESLLEAGSLKPSDDGSCLVFTKDWAFNSPSAASATVLGRPDNGRTSWRLSGTSITYAAWQDNLPESHLASGRTE
jgi:hypothetical protein